MARANEDRAMVLLAAFWVALLIAAILSSCAYGTRPAPARVGDPQVKVVSEIVYPVSAEWWRQAPWYDMHNDVETPTRLLLSGPWACVQYKLYVDEPKVGFAYRCYEGWRSGPYKKTPG